MRNTLSAFFIFFAIMVNMVTWGPYDILVLFGENISVATRNSFVSGISITLIIIYGFVVLFEYAGYEKKMIIIVERAALKTARSLGLYNILVFRKPHQLTNF